MKKLAIAGLLAAALSLTALSEQRAAAGGGFNLNLGITLSGNWWWNPCCTQGCGDYGCSSQSYGYPGYGSGYYAAYAAPYTATPAPAAPAPTPAAGPAVAPTGFQTAGYSYPAPGYGYGYGYSAPGYGYGYGYYQAPSYWYGR